MVRCADLTGWRGQAYLELARTALVARVKVLGDGTNDGTTTASALTSSQ
jgi:hypothetical protein